MCEVASFKNFENSLTTVKVMTKTNVAPFYLGHGVYRQQIKFFVDVVCNGNSLEDTGWVREEIFLVREG